MHGLSCSLWVGASAIARCIEISPTPRVRIPAGKSAWSWTRTRSSARKALPTAKSNVHDGGQLNKVEATLFFRHRDFGAIGPYVRYMDMPVTKNSGRHGRDQQLHYGFVYGTRPGFIRPRHGNIDLFLLQVIADFQDDEFGVHTYRVPAYILAVYRATLRLL
jgi:hypothetical protein